MDNFSTCGSAKLPAFATLSHVQVIPPCNYVELSILAKDIPQGVEDLNVSCNPAQVTIFGEWLSKKYGVAKATHRGKVHNYPGTIFDFLAKGKVKVTMMEYIKNIIKDIPEEITGTKTSPATDNLFTVRDLSLAKAYQRSRQWHSIVQRPSSCL